MLCVCNNSAYTGREYKTICLFQLLALNTPMQQMQQLLTAAEVCPSEQVSSVHMIFTATFSFFLSIRLQSYLLIKWKKLYKVTSVAQWPGFNFYKSESEIKEYKYYCVVFPGSRLSVKWLAQGWPH